MDKSNQLNQKPALRTLSHSWETLKNRLVEYRVEERRLGNTASFLQISFHLVEYLSYLAPPIGSVQVRSWRKLYAAQESPGLIHPCSQSAGLVLHPPNNHTSSSVAKIGASKSQGFKGSVKSFAPLSILGRGILRSRVLE